MPLVTDELEVNAQLPVAVGEPVKKKHTVRNIVLWLVGLVMLAGFGFVVFVVYLFMYASSSCDKRETELQSMAKKNVAILDGLTILDGRHVKSTGAPDGDCLTGSGGPATAVYPVTGTVAEVNAQVTRSLKGRGFEMGPKFYMDSTSSLSVTDIWTVAKSGDSTLQIWYKLEKPYTCPNDLSTCGGTGVLQRPELLNESVREVSVTLGGTIITPE